MQHSTCDVLIHITIEWIHIDGFLFWYFLYRRIGFKFQPVNRLSHRNAISVTTIQWEAEQYSMRPLDFPLVMAILWFWCFHFAMATPLKCSLVTISKFIGKILHIFSFSRHAFWKTKTHSIDSSNICEIKKNRKFCSNWFNSQLIAE